MESGSHRGENMGSGAPHSLENEQASSQTHTHSHTSIPANRGPTFRRVEQNRQTIDVPTREMAKKYFKLIQAIHHKEIIDKAINTQCHPAGMTKQANKLLDFIKPAAPTEQTKEKIKLNTEKWMEVNLTILQDHYVDTIALYSDPTKNDVALQVAPN